MPKPLPPIPPGTMTKDDYDKLARAVDGFLNGDAKGKDKQNAFVILVCPFAGAGENRTNYVSNANRPDILSMMKEIVARFEGRYAEEAKESKDGRVN